MANAMIAVVSFIVAIFFGHYGIGFHGGAVFGSASILCLWTVDDFVCDCMRSRK